MLEGQYIGVVIPARNEEQHIGTVLETLPEFIDMAVVIDDGSTDNTAEVCSGYKNVKLIKEIVLDTLELLVVS